MLGEMRVRGRIGVATALVMAGVLACSVGASARSEASGALFRVTLTGQLKKDWTSARSVVEGECTSRTTVTGQRTITLRSSRPTLVRVTFAGGGVQYRPRLLRHVTATATQSGSVLVSDVGGPGCRRTTRNVCDRPRQALANQTLRFFRSGRGQISFSRTRDFGSGLSSTCPPQSEVVRVETPALRDAKGQISETGLRKTSIRTLGGSASSAETTDFEGEEDGKVVERVSWKLTFSRVPS